MRMFYSHVCIIQTAVHAQLEALKRSNPNTIALVLTFATSVTVYGDGQAEVATIDDSVVNDYEKLMKMVCVFFMLFVLWDLQINF